MTCRESQGGGESKGGNIAVNESGCYQDSCAASCGVGVKGRAAQGGAAGEAGGRRRDWGWGPTLGGSRH